MREILEKVFGIVCNLSLVGSYCILLVLVARLVLRRAPRWCSYLLWGIVFLRLCCPVFPQTQISQDQRRQRASYTIAPSVHLCHRVFALSACLIGIYHHWAYIKKAKEIGWIPIEYINY